MDAEAIPFALPFIGAEEEEAVLRVLRSGWLTTGAEALAFEREFAAFLEGAPAAPAEAAETAAPLQAPAVNSARNLPRSPAETSPLHALAVNSATSGLHLALEACGVGPGDLVLVPSYTFTSTAEVVRYLGAELVFVDTVPGGFHLDSRALERTLARLSAGLPAYPPRKAAAGKAAAGEGFGPRGRPAALIPVHYGGLPCDMEAIMAIARAYGLRVVEDAAHAFPSRLPDGRYAGTLADAGVFSFYATKTITTGEGGMVVTRDAALAKRMAVMRSHGIDRAAWNRYTDLKASWYYEVIAPGFKYNLPDLLAAVGRVQLSRAPSLLEKRRRIALRYDEAFRGEAGLVIPPGGPADARHLYPLRLRPGGLSRDRFIEKLRDRGVGTSVHFIPLHTMPYYRSWYKLEAEDFPESLAAFAGVVSLPIWPGMGEAQVDRVIAAVRETAREGQARVG
jgi:dTDP-4-amino-4,6-dideoxygalactose transaminase